MNSQQRPPTHLAPIHFSLATAFSVTTMWAVLFAVMSLLHFPARGYLIISLLFVVVAAARLLFRRFRYSVFVSMAAGILYVVVAEPIFRISQGLSIVTS